MFLSPRQKLNRARKHISELTEVIETHKATSPVLQDAGPSRISQDGVHTSPKFTTPPLPHDTPVILGDIIHNLRSSLDLLASEMARLNGKSDRYVYFPFAADEAGLPKMIIQKKFHYCGRQAVALVKTLAPYKGGNIKLRAIHDLNVMDKHRSLIPESKIGINYRFQAPLANLSIDPHDYFFHFPEECLLGEGEIVAECEGLVQLCEGILEAFAALEFPK